MLVVTKLRDGGLQNFADVSYLLGVADDGELEEVRALATGEDTEFMSDIEDLLAIGKLEADMRERR